MDEFFVRANGLDHHVIGWGNRDAPHTLVMCHGFLDLAWGFCRLAQRIALRDVRVLAFDFRGHGETEWLGRGGYYHFVDYILDLHELMPQLSQKPVHLLGHSMGGTVSTMYAGAHPEQIRSLTLLEGYGPPTLEMHPVDRLLGWMRDVDGVRAEPEPVRLRDLDEAKARLLKRNPTLDAEFLHGLAGRSTKVHPKGEGLTWRFDPLHRSRSPLGFDRERFTAFASRITAQTLFIQGENGMRVGDDDARMASYPNARRVEVPGAGHMLQWTHANEVADHVISFLGV